MIRLLSGNSTMNRRLIRYTEAALVVAFFVVILLLRVYFYVFPRLRELYLWAMPITPTQKDKPK